MTIHVPPPKLKKGENNTSDDDNEEYYVEKVLAYEDRKNGRYFRLKWKGYDESYNSWEPADNLTHAKESIEEFMKNKPKEVNKKQTLRRSLRLKYISHELYNKG
jgi:hypothetical protein